MEESKYQGFSAKSTADGKALAYVYYGTKSEMEALAASHRVDEADEAGRLKAIRVGRSKGPVWECELSYESIDDWQSIAAPDRNWGARTCQLHGSMVSRPLPLHPDYRTKWEYYLAAATGILTLPSWWNTARNTVITIADRAKYRWCRGSGELPPGWTIVKAPTKPGVTCFDVAEYIITEVARFRSAAAASRMAVNSLNRVGSPPNNFGIVHGNWKCDDAEVSWNGRFWVAKLCWTHCTDCWDEELYGNLE